MQCQLADLFPHPLQIFIIALDFSFGAFGPGGAHNQASPLRHFHRAGNFLELFTVGRIGDLTADAAAARGVGHQNAIATRQAKICRQRSAFVAAFFFDNLNQQYLPNLDDFLNLVTPGARFTRWADIVDVVIIGDRFDAFVFCGCIARHGIGCVVVFTVGLCRCACLGVSFGCLVAARFGCVIFGRFCIAVCFGRVGLGFSFCGRRLLWRFSGCGLGGLRCIRIYRSVGRCSFWRCSFWARSFPTRSF